MKVAPVSADLLVKVALGAAAIGALWYVTTRVRDQLRAGLGGAAEWAQNLAETSLNPASDQNLIYRPITAGITAATGQEDSLGTWWRGLTSNDDQRVRDMLQGRSGGATGSW